MDQAFIELQYVLGLNRRKVVQTLFHKSKSALELPANCLGRNSPQLGLESRQVIYFYLNHVLLLLISYLSIGVLFN